MNVRGGIIKISPPHFFVEIVGGFMDYYYICMQES